MGTALYVTRQGLTDHKLDEPIIEYLASLALEAATAAGPARQTSTEHSAGLAEALTDCLPPTAGQHDMATALVRELQCRLYPCSTTALGAPGATHVGKAGQQMSDTGAGAEAAFVTIAAASPTISGQHQKQQQQHAESAASVSGRPAPTLRATAAEFVPQRAAGPILPAFTPPSAPAALAPKPGPEAAAAWQCGADEMYEWYDQPGGDHLLQAQEGGDWGIADQQPATPIPCPEDCGPAQPQPATHNLRPEDAAELLQMWFPDFGAHALEQLFGVAKDLWVCVEELLLMEGEEPYESRLRQSSAAAAAAGAAAAEAASEWAASLALADAESFPSLSGGAAPATATATATTQQRGWGQPQAGTRSARDALLSANLGGTGSSSSGRGAWGPGSGGGKASTAPLWPQLASKGSRGEGALDASGETAFPPLMLPGGIPVVQSGAQLTRLYEAAREEAKEHARARQECFHKATVAYLSGHVDQARRLSLEARAHGERMAAADAQAAHSIFQARNASSSGNASPFLDLHGLHVREACALLSAILQQRMQQQQQQRRASSVARRLVVCTGAGKHSERNLKGAATGQGGAAGRLEAAVERVLNKQGVAFRRLQPGLFEVTA